MSWEEQRKVKCPICGTDMDYIDFEWEDGLFFDFECPKCGLTTRIHLDEDQMVKTILAKIGYEEVKVKAEKGEKSEAEG